MIASRPAFILATALACAGLPAPAQTVTVTPGTMSFQAGTTVHDAATACDPAEFRARFQFRAHLEGADPQPSWDWTVVAEDGAPLADGGSITQEGLYTPPGFSLSPFRRIRIRATSRQDLARTGCAQVSLRPHRALAALEAVLGRHWRGSRLEHLAGAPAAGKAADSPIGPEARFTDVAEIAFVPRLPWRDGAFRDQWLVLDDSRLRLVGPGGAVRTLHFQGQPGPAHRFLRMAVPPWSGPEDGEWRCFLFDGADDRIYRCDARGALARHAFAPPLTLSITAPILGMFAPTPAAMVADRAGNLYLAQSVGRFGTVIVKIDPEGRHDNLAGQFQYDSPPRDGRGREARFKPCHGLALDEARGVLHVLEAEHLRSVRLADGEVATLPVRHGLTRPDGLALHGGQLVVGSTEPDAILLADPDTGRTTPVLADPGPRRGPDPAHLFGFKPGPCLGAIPGLAPEQCGCLDRMHPQRFAVGRHGQIGVLTRAGVALVLPDWGPLRLRLAAPAAGGAELKSLSVPPSPGGNAGRAAGPGAPIAKRQRI